MSHDSQAVFVAENGTKTVLQKILKKLLDGLVRNAADVWDTHSVAH